MSRRLHSQIFGALVLTGALCLALTAAVAWLLHDRTQSMPHFAQDAAALLVADLPEHDPAALHKQLARRAKRLHASISLWDEQGRLLARVGRRLGPERISVREAGYFEHRDRGVRLRLDDGRTLAVSFDDVRAVHRAGPLTAAALLLFGTLLLGSYIAARRITRRLERLEHGVTRLGDGDLEVRVEVRGRDEIARLAAAFNRSFERIAGLLKQQRRMLQSASHELRSPLARLRMALELTTDPLTGDDAREQLRAEATRDIEELDALIGDLLLAGRLADSALPKHFSEVLLSELVQQEAARVSAEAQVVPCSVRGDARMLRSLVRNLLENARRYGRDPVRALLEIEGGRAVLRVEDGGDGIAASERERIFEPFYRPPGHHEGKDGGVGLGLALVRHIAEHHEGQVLYVPSERGTCFEVRLDGARSERGPSVLTAR